MEIPKARGGPPSVSASSSSPTPTSSSFPPSTSVFDWRPQATSSSPSSSSSSSTLSAAPPPSLSSSPLSISASAPLLLSSESITLLPQRLRLASIQRDESDVCIKTILQHSFYPSRPGRFFSYTVTEEEISLVMDEETVATFPSDSLVLSPDHLRAIQVYEGAQAINMTGYVSLLSGGITKEGINVLYFSTFNTDLLLVDEKKIDRALVLLKKTLADFNSGAKAKPIPPSPVTQPHSAATNQSVSKQMLLSPLSKDLSLACMATSDIPMCTHQLLKAFLSNTAFFSFTSSGDELSLILDDELMEGFPTGVLTVHHSKWKSIQVDFGSLGFTETGVVSLLADILAQEGISIYYLSTFSTDFILVESIRVKETISIVSRRLAQMERAM